MKGSLKYTGDFNIHVDNPSISIACEFLTLLSSTNLTQHVNSPTHYQNHTLDLVITSSPSNLSPDSLYLSLLTRHPIITPFSHSSTYFLLLVQILSLILFAASVP